LQQRWQGGQAVAINSTSTSSGSACAAGSCLALAKDHQLALQRLTQRTLE
jgi:hypothetical protein